MQIKGKFLSFDKVNANGCVFSKDCKIDYPEKVPIIWDFKPTVQNVLGNAKVIKEEDGLYFDGEFIDQNMAKAIKIASANLGVGGFYNRVKRDNDEVIDMNLCYISITPTPVSPDYKFEVVENEE